MTRGGASGLLAGLVTLCLLWGTAVQTGWAASLGGADSDDLYATFVPTPACDSEVTATLSGANATFSDVDAACASLDVQVTALAGATVVSSTSGVAATQTFVVTFPASVGSATGLALTIGGLGVAVVIDGLPFTVTPTIYSDWGDGYCANVVVSTASPTKIEWSSAISLATAPLDGTPTNVWDVVWSFAGQTLTATPKPYNRFVRAKKPVTWGFCALRPPPPSTTTSSTIPPPVSYDTTITNDWGTGYCAEVTVTTTSATPGTWAVEVDLSTAPLDGVPSTVWNATTTFDAPILAAQGAGWNDQVSATTPRTWGFCANR